MIVPSASEGALIKGIITLIRVVVGNREFGVEEFQDRINIKRVLVGLSSGKLSFSPRFFSLFHLVNCKTLKCKKEVDEVPNLPLWKINIFHEFCEGLLKINEFSVDVLQHEGIHRILSFHNVFI